MNKTEFFAAVRPMFGGKLTAPQVNGLDHLLAATDGLPIAHRAYLLATAMHETARTMQPVRETLAGTDNQAIARLEAAWSKGRLPWVKAPYWRKDHDGKAWFGRGYVQLTHRDNYAKAGKMVGVDLVRDPSLALDPAIAARVLVQGCENGIFTGVGLSDYLDGAKPDYVSARKVVNGTDKAQAIADLARGFEKALRAGESVPVGDAVTKPKSPASGVGIAAAIVALIGAVIAFFGGR